MSEQLVDPGNLAKMYLLIVGYRASQAISVVANLGVADLIAETPRSVDELAGETKTDTLSLARLLRMLASLGIFAEDSPGTFRHTELSRILCLDHPQSLRGGAIMNGAEFMWKPWLELRQAVTTGRPSFDRVYGAALFDYLATHPDDAGIFNAGMTSASTVFISAILAAYDFSRFQHVVDVGGEHGALLHVILSAHPKLRGVLFDLPEVIAGATALRKGDVAHRCELVAGDFFKSVPEDADGYIVKHVVHDWSDEDALKILRNCRLAIRRDGQLLLIEAVLRPSNQPDPGRFNDLNMLVMLKGRERSAADFRVLLGGAGFSLAQVHPLLATIAIIEAQPTSTRTWLSRNSSENSMPLKSEADITVSFLEIINWESDTHPSPFISHNQRLCGMTSI